MRFRMHWAIGLMVLASAMTTVLAAGPAQAAACSPYLQTQVPQRVSIYAVRGAVYLKSNARACANKRIVVYAKVRSSNGGWSGVMKGSHYVPSDEFGWTMTSNNVLAYCGQTVRSVYRLYNNSSGTGGYTQVEGGAHSIGC